MATPNTAETNPLGNFRWYVCVLLFFATTINYIDRQILALLKPLLDEELHWTNEQFGLMNTAFQGAYGLGLLWFGWFVDRFGSKIGYAVSIAAWSLAAMAHAMVGSVGGFVAARAALGVSEGGNFPAAIKVVTLWFKPQERSFATSLFNSGANVGAVVAPALVPVVAYLWGWQAAFLLAGAAGFLWLIIWLRSYREPAEPATTEPTPTDVTKARVPWSALLRYRQTWSFIVAKFLTDPVWWFFLIWLPDYFKQTRGLQLKESWVHLVTIYLIITALSVVGGWITGYFASRGWSVTRARKTGMFIFALCVVPIFAATSVGDWTAVLLIALAGAAHQAWSANLYTTVSDMLPKRAVASVIGLGSFAGATGGMLFPYFTGKLLDASKDAGGITGGYTTLFTICACAYLVAFAIHHVLAPRFEQIEKADDILK